MIYVNEFIESKINENLQDATIKEYRYYLSQFESFLLKHLDKTRIAKLTLAHIKRPDIQAYIDWVRDSGKSQATARKHLAYVKEFVYYLEGLGVMDSYCVFNVKIKKDKGVRELKQHMTVEQAMEFYNSITDDYDKCIVALALFHGFRRNEIAEVLVENIDLENWTIKFVRKGQFEEKIKLQAQVRELVAKQVEFCKDNGHIYLFQSPRKIQPLSVVSVWKVFKKWLSAVGMEDFDFSTHDFRRAFALSLYEDGYKLEEIQVALSHASVETTRKYVNLTREKVMESIGNRESRG